MLMIYKPLQRRSSAAFLHGNPPPASRTQPQPREEIQEKRGIGTIGWKSALPVAGSAGDVRAELAPRSFHNFLVTPLALVPSPALPALQHSLLQLSSSQLPDVGTKSWFSLLGRGSAKLRPGAGSKLLSPAAGAEAGSELPD